MSDDTISDEDFAAIVEGMAEATAHARGEATLRSARAPERVDVKAIRAKLGVSQDQFARMFGVSKDTVQGWEQLRRRPEGPSRALLKVIDKEPEAVQRALAAS